MRRVHITIPEKYMQVFGDYTTARQISLSAFLVKAGTEKISRHKGEWLQRIHNITDPERIEISQADFDKLTDAEKWEFVRGLI